ncbi:MAG: hypothetical protein WHV66_05015 [Anaerolineales bacterium]
MSQEKATSHPPRLINCFATGFNTVANNAYLLLFPILLDIFLWFGPHFRLTKLVKPFFTDFAETLKLYPPTNTAELFNNSLAQTWQYLIDRFNLASVICTFPIGIPSLMSSMRPVQSPLGEVPIYDITTPSGFLLLWLGMILTGLLIGSIYFSEIARCCSNDRRRFSAGWIGDQFTRAVILSILLTIFAVMISIPTSLLTGITFLINPFLGQIAMIAMLFVFLWLLMPLLFSPHGIFIRQYGVISSLLASVRLVRFLLPTINLFVLISLLLWLGLDYLWLTPPETSWMTLVGISGHAFITTGLIASSFILYDKGLHWLDENLSQLATRGIRA